MEEKITQGEFFDRVYQAAAQIPRGRVTTYGQLAFLAGYPRRARMAGRAMAFAPQGLPCHRVVNSQGRTAPGWAEQRRLLEAEGVAFRENGCVDMKRFRWKLF
ncbi:MAG: MGMT family protein [Oscillospiraceae bacterium]|nr:MGMT family protein [Oscillospiraceae bacterium]